ELPAAELRAAVMRGSGLLIDGLNDGKNNQLVQCGGVTYNGKFASADQPLALLGSLFTPGDYRITALPVQLRAVSPAVAQARLGPVATPSDGIISAQLGQGKTLTFGFDLSDTLRSTQASGSASDKARWLDVTQKSLSWLKPVPDSSSPASYFGGEIVSVATRLQNTGSAAVVQLLQTLPAGAQVISTTPLANPVSNGSASWTIALPAGADITLTLRLRLPAGSGNVNLLSQINLLNDGVASPYKTLNLEFLVSASTDSISQFATDISALRLTTNAEVDARSAILAELSKVSTALSRKQFDQALRRLLLVQARLARIDSDGAQAAKLARVIAAVQAQSNK
ncbi:MAG: hypothetical protein RL748_2038, partial [Pseudomonadota bacterium]